MAVVRDLAKTNTTRFRASFVAEKAGVPLDEARRDLVRLVNAGELLMNFELLCPFDDATVAVFHARELIPTTFTSEECGDGEEFEVTPELIWVTFTATDELRAEVQREQAAALPPAPPEEGPPPGKRWSQRAAAKKTRSRSTSHRPMLH